MNEIKTLEISDLWACYDARNKRVGVLSRENAELKQQLAEAEKVIEFYGNEDNYDWADFEAQVEIILSDDGKLARQYKQKYMDNKA